MFALYLLLLLAPPSGNAAWPAGAAVSPVNQSQDTQPTPKQDFPKGQIVAKVTCTQAPTQSYALYLPSNYDAARRWPILYAFDPGARGQVPVDRFQEAAEKFGWIIAGSNNSRNASIQSSIDAWNAITRDTADKFSIDGGRVYAAGFSGGARMAILFATQCHDCLTGVIAGGAGFPEGIEPDAKMHFALFAAAGIDDFNFAEIKMLAEKLSRLNMPHLTETFAGRHEWLPSSVAMDAVAWMELLAMKTKLRQRDDPLIESLWNQRLKQAQELEDAKNLYDAYQRYVNLSASFKGLREVADIENKLNQLRNGREVRDALRDEQQQIKKQRELEDKIIDLINHAERGKGRDNNQSPERNTQANDEGFDDRTRLQGIMAELRRQAVAEPDSATRRVARRVISGQYIGLVERGSNALQNQKRFDDAVWFFSMATEVDPERAGAFYNLAWAYGAKGDKKKSLKALQTAVDKGFSDAAALAANKAFDSLRDDPQYQKIISSLKTR